MARARAAGTARRLSDALGELEEILIAIGVLTLALGALELGFRFGRRREAMDHLTSQVAPIQGAILGLLGLLLAFSFSAASARFLERQDLILAEANAIGTAYLRADLIGEPHRGELRSALQRYTEERVTVSKRLRYGIGDADLAAIGAMHGEIWSAASAGVAAAPAATLAVLGPVNELIDLHATRVAASRRHLPAPVVGLLLVCSVLAIGLTGYACGLGDRNRSPLSFALALVIAVALWLTIDLDYPRMGLLQVSDAPLAELRFE